MFAPLSGKTISCTTSMGVSSWVSVDASGNVNNHGCGAVTSCAAGLSTTVMMPTGIVVTDGYGTTCSANWPAL